MSLRPGNRPSGLSSEASIDGVGTTPDSTVVADEAPAVCETCSRALSVGERMFYFLEGDGASPQCRSCLASLEEGELERSAGPLEVISWRKVDAPTALRDSPEGSTELARVVRAYLQDEFDRADVILDRAPSDHPDLPLARSLRAESQQLFFSGQLAESVTLLRDLRRVLVGFENGRKRVPLMAPWDESVEELFDRVQARSIAMARSGVAAGPVEESDLEVRVPGRRRGSTAPE